VNHGARKPFPAQKLTQEVAIYMIIGLLEIKLQEETPKPLDPKLMSNLTSRKML
jgi:hypothetical protein